MAATASLSLPTALDTTIAVITPENSAFEYQIAGPLRRTPAYLIDVLVRWAVIILLVITFFLLGLAINIAVMGPYILALILIAYFLLSWFYGTVMETYYNGRTIGKWACGIRAIDVTGKPMNGRSAFLRNLLRVADFAPMAALTTFNEALPALMWIPTGMVALLSMVVTRRMQRLGDLAAGTMVIVDERHWSLPVAKIEDPRVPALASFIPGDYRISRSMARTLAIYAERRQYLTPQRRREIARHLADPLIERFEFRNDIDTDLLLYALYYRAFLMKSDEEPDLGALAGYSPMQKDQGRVE